MNKYINAINFGVPPDNDPQSYLISRMEAHADLHLTDQLQFFVQLQNDIAPGKTIIFPVDKDRLDLEQAFVLITEPFAGGRFRFRGGRQQMAFDLQRFVSVRDGPNVRQSFDALWTSYDWDLETMGQTGNIACKRIRAWAIGSVSGYTFQNLCLKPRIGFQFDMGSGTRNPNSNTLSTFNPLFPNGAYFTLADFTSYANLIHIKPSLTLTPNQCWSLMFAAAGQWRETTADAIYTEPHIPIPGTAGIPGKYTGTYFQTHIDWKMSPHIQNFLEIVYFNVGSAIRSAGGHNSTYVGIESKFGW